MRRWLTRKRQSHELDRPPGRHPFRGSPRANIPRGLRRHNAKRWQTNKGASEWQNRLTPTVEIVAALRAVGAGGAKPTAGPWCLDLFVAFRGDWHGLIRLSRTAQTAIKSPVDKRRRTRSHGTASSADVRDGGKIGTS